jgi:hypothetical protein
MHRFSSGTRVLGGLPLFALALAAMGCGEVSSPGANGGGPARAGTGGGSAGSAGRAGAGAGGASGGAPSDAGYEGDAAAGSGGAAGSAGTASTVPPGCPVPAPEPVLGQVVAIQSLKFADEDDPASDPAEIVVRNVSSSSVTLVGSRLGWQWCSVPAYWAITEGPDVTLAPGATYAFVPYYNQGGPRPLFRGDDAQDTNELGIYPRPGTFDEADQIMAFVIWGQGSAGDTRESIGVMAGFWTFGEKITIGPNDAGFVATGPTNRGDGYTGVPARCLVAPPNP